MKSVVKKIIPKPAFSLYHYLFAFFANIIFGIPSRRLIVIGITGTKGKTSTANFVWSVLQAGGIKTGMLTTANIRIGETEEENNFHMTMPGRFYIQRMLSKMVKEKCEVAIVETTSQGISQFRHLGIRYDICIFTNLTPEHIESHGSFENYKLAKGKMFKALSKYKNKKWRGKDFLKTIVANADSGEAEYFLNFKSDIKKTYSISENSDFKAEDVVLNSQNSNFVINKDQYEVRLPGKFNIYNVLPAIVVGNIFDVSTSNIKNGLKSLLAIPGRMEEVETHKNFRVFVDYAHEPAGLQSVIETANQIKEKNARSIVLIGCAGGGRDRARRSVIGNVAGKYANIVIISDDEPYEENPKEIREEIKKGANASGKKEEDENLFDIGDRREAIKKALSLAKEGDVVIFTGLGHQKVRMIGKKQIPWVERQVVEEELKNIYA